MQISYQSRGRGIVLKLKGRLDLEHVSRLTAEVRDAMVHKPAFIILNMIDVLDLSSTGIGRIFHLLNECERRNIQLVISDPSAVTEYVLDLAQMTDVFAIYRSDEEALKELDA